MNWFRRLFCKKETRVITQPESSEVLETEKSAGVKVEEKLEDQEPLPKPGLKEASIYDRLESLGIDGKNINAPSSNAVLAERICIALNKGLFAKPYKNIEDFMKYREDSLTTINDIPDEVLSCIKITPEIEKLKAVWKRLKYRCKDEALNKYMLS